MSTTLPMPTEFQTAPFDVATTAQEWMTFPAKVRGFRLGGTPKIILKMIMFKDQKDKKSWVDTAKGILAPETTICNHSPPPLTFSSLLLQRSVPLQLSSCQRTVHYVLF